jgi:GNAT superfamily N-acetyltransferase
VLRPARSEDAPRIAEVFTEARTRCLPFLPPLPPLEVMQEVFTKYLDERTAWVAEEDQSVVGFIGFYADEVDHLWVLPECHGRGIGSALLEVALDRARGPVHLWVFQENRSARAFYERRGFRLELETDGQGNMEKTPDARYVWRPASDDPK